MVGLFLHTCAPEIPKAVNWLSPGAAPLINASTTMMLQPPSQLHHKMSSNNSQLFLPQILSSVLLPSSFYSAPTQKLLTSRRIQKQGHLSRSIPHRGSSTKYPTAHRLLFTYCLYIDSPHRLQCIAEFLTAYTADTAAPQLPLVPTPS
jgi:hypothetical protein